jgi:hypothetical protein
MNAGIYKNNNRLLSQATLLRIGELEETVNNDVESSRIPETVQAIKPQPQPKINNDSHEVWLTLVKNTWDNTVVYQVQNPWGEFCEFFSTHREVPSKSEAMMVIPSTFKTVEDDDYEPARYGRKSKKAGEIKYTDDGKPHVQRCKANLIDVYMLPLDMDGGLTIEEAKEKFKDYEYFAYTSAGHRTEAKEGKDAFRIFLPFNRPITSREYSLRADSFREWVGEMDQSSVDVARGFYVPSYITQNKDNGHLTWRNEGRLLNPDDFEEKPETIYEAKPIVCSGVKGNEVKGGTILWKTLDIVAMFKAMGLYRGHSSGRKHDVVCPWVHEHTANDDTGTAIFERTGMEEAGFNCYHNSCHGKHRGAVVKHFREQNGMDWLRQFYDVVPNKNDYNKMMTTMEQRIKELKEMRGK